MFKTWSIHRSRYFSLAVVSLLAAYLAYAATHQARISFFFDPEGAPLSGAGFLLLLIPRAVLVSSIFILCDVWAQLSRDFWCRIFGAIAGAYVALVFRFPFRPYFGQDPLKDITDGVVFLYIALIIGVTIQGRGSETLAGLASATTSPLEGRADRDALGSGETPYDRVARALIRRSLASRSSSRKSMSIMVVLVFAGCVASVGFWFESQESRLRDLAEQRTQIARLALKLDDAIAQTNDPGMSADWNKLSKSIRDVMAVTKPSEAAYQQVLNEVRISEKTSWQDIAIRATIAILTLFLVQIFFSVFRYHRSLSNLLAAKAEALELCKDDPDAVYQLRLQITSVLTESLPSFTGGPRMPLDSVMDAAKKLAPKHESSSK